MRQRYFETNGEDLFYRIKTIIDNGGHIVQVVNVGILYLIIYINKP